MILKFPGKRYKEIITKDKKRIQIFRLNEILIIAFYSELNERCFSHCHGVNIDNDLGQYISINDFSPKL